MPSQPQDKMPSKEKQVTRNRSTTPPATDELPVEKKTDNDDSNLDQSPDEERPTSSQDDLQRQRPETLATLALQLLQPKLASMRDSKDRLSAASFDGIYYDALVRADSLLNLAAGLADEEIHVYQLFTENSPPISYQAIADRFAEVVANPPHKNLPTAKGTIKDRVEEILSEARKHISDALDYENAQLSLAMGVPVDIVTLRKRVRKQIESLIRRTLLGRVVRDPSSFADEISNFFVKRLGEEINRGDLWFVEYCTSAYGEYEFIEHVCDGLSYEEFMNENHLKISLTFDETNAILFYLRQLGTEMIGQVQTRDQILKMASLLERGAEVLKPVVQKMKECSDRLNLRVPDLDEAKRCAVQAADLLEPVLDHWLFRRYWRMLPIMDIKCQLPELLKTLEGGLAGDCNAGDEFSPPTSEYVRSFVDVLDEAIDFAKPDAIPAKRAKYLDLLKDISNCARFIKMSDKQNARPVLSDEWTRDLSKIANAADDWIYLEPVNAREQWRRVDEILKAEKKPSASRKVKAYELFLFAAQAGIMQDRLVIRRSDLKSSCRVSPKHDLRQSVVFATRGALRIGD